MNTTASAVVPGREAVEWLFDIHPIHITPQQIDELQEKSRTLLAEVDRLNAELKAALMQMDANAEFGVQANKACDSIRTTVAQLERTVADQAAALAERDKVTDAMVERARIAETNFNVDIRGNGSCDRRAWHHSTEWTFGEEVFQSIDEAKIAQNRARLRMAIDAALAASVSRASEEETK